MHGVTRILAGGIARDYYRCSGKDRVMTARETACRRAHVNGVALEAAVWDACPRLALGSCPAAGAI